MPHAPGSEGGIARLGDCTELDRLLPQAKVLAADRGTCIQLDYDELRGRASSTPTLF